MSWRITAMTVGVIGIIFTIGIAVCIELPKRYINEKTSVLQLLRTTISHIDEYMPHCFLYTINLVACVTYIWAASQRCKLCMLPAIVWWAVPAVGCPILLTLAFINDQIGKLGLELFFYIFLAAFAVAYFLFATLSCVLMNGNREPEMLRQVETRKYNVAYARANDQNAWD